MKKFIVFIFSIFCFYTSAQSEGITYQAVIYDPNVKQLPGANHHYSPLINKLICLRFNLFDSNGVLEYQEYVETTTDSFGMVNLIVGANTPTTGGYASLFSQVQWMESSKSLKVELDSNGDCQNYEEISNQPLNYVPFSYYAVNTNADIEITALQAKVDNNKIDSDAADETLLNSLNILSEDVGQNEADSDTAIATLQADVDQNEADSDTAIATLQADVDQNEADSDTAIATLQADVDQNEVDADAADATLQSNIETVQADVDQNEADSDTAIATLQADVDQNEVDADAADATLQSNIDTVQADVDQNEADSDTAIATLQADVDQNEVDADAADATLQSNIDTVQADVDQNEADSDTAIATLQADVDQNEVDADAGITALQADVNGNEADADAADATLQSNIDTVQADVDQNEADSDTAIATLQADVDQNEVDADAADATLQSNIDTVQADVDQNEADSDTAIATLQADVDQNEVDADAADATLQSNIDTVQADVDQNEADSDTAIATLQADVDQNEVDADAADATLQSNIDTVQADVDQNNENSATNTANIATNTANISINIADINTNASQVSAIQTQIDNLLNKIATLENTVAILQEFHVPEITLTGSATISVNQSSGSYDDAGATANDLNDGDITTSIVTVNPVDINNVGTYIVTYNVTDSDGNAASEVTRTVNVVDDIPPVITLDGDNPVTIEVGSTYTDAGANAVDNLDGNITNTMLVVNSVNVNTSLLGTYEVTYNAIDSNGNVAAQVTRSVIVVDTTKPVITISGTNPDSVEASATQTSRLTHTDTSVYVTTPSGGNKLSLRDDKWSLNPSIDHNLHNLGGVLEVKGGTYTITGLVSAGTYITYTVTPNPGSWTNSNRSVTTTYDVTTESEDYEDSGATASDNYDGNITGDIVTTNNVDRGTIGTHTVTYNVTDSSGNTADQKTRTVNVVDTTSPVITLVGSTPVNVDLGSVYNDAGATASDSFDGNLTESIISVNPVDTSSAGSYIVTYNVNDASGNSATEVTRTVNVVDTTPPEITGSENVNVNENETAVGIYSVNESVIWSISGDDSSNFSINQNSGAVVFSSEPDYETPTDDDADNVYTITLTATDDSGNESSVNVIITVVNVVEAFSGSNFSIQGTTTTDTTATINWTYAGDIGAPGVEGYFLWVRIGRGGSWNPVTVFKQTIPNSASLTSYTVTGLSPGTLYAFRLWPIYNGNQQYKSSEPLFTTQNLVAN